MEASNSNRPSESTRERFLVLAERWRRDTAISSSASGAAKHPAYKEIIGMGHDVLPFILAELAEQTDHWFLALNEITGENPIPPETEGDVEAMRKAWIAWGRSQGLLTQDRTAKD